MISPFEFQLRPRVRYHAGVLAELGSEASHLGAQRALIVADEGVEQAGLLDHLHDYLNGFVEIAGTLIDTPTNASIETIDRGAAYARQQGADSIIAFGGGAAIDMAKCLRMVLSEGGQLYDYVVHPPAKAPIEPLIVVPTIASTGSEVTPFATIRNRQSNRTLVFSSPYLAPQLALLDPLITRNLPATITAAAGMVALAHAIESFAASKIDPISQSLGLSAIDMIANNLRAATHNGDDIDARGQMLVASCMAGMASASGALGVINALTHAISALFEIHQGTISAVLLPYGMAFNSGAVPNRYARIARALGVNAGGRAEDDVIADGIAAVRSLAIDCLQPHQLRDIGIAERDFATIVESALDDPTIGGNPRSVTYDDLLTLLREAT